MWLGKNIEFCAMNMFCLRIFKWMYLVWEYSKECVSNFDMTFICDDEFLDIYVSNYMFAI